jgi:hypothetical protein
MVEKGKLSVADSRRQLLVEANRSFGLAQRRWDRAKPVVFGDACTGFGQDEPRYGEPPFVKAPPMISSITAEVDSDMRDLGKDINLLGQSKDFPTVKSLRRIIAKTKSIVAAMDELEKVKNASWIPGVL